MDEISLGNLRSPMTIRLVGESRALKCLTPLFSVSSWEVRNLGIVDLQGP
jgi:hypothetical protein